MASSLSFHTYLKAKLDDLGHQILREYERLHCSVENERSSSKPRTTEQDAQAHFSSSAVQERQCEETTPGPFAWVYAQEKVLGKFLSEGSVPEKTLQAGERLLTKFQSENSAPEKEQEMFMDELFAGPIRRIPNKDIQGSRGRVKEGMMDRHGTSVWTRSSRSNAHHPSQKSNGALIRQPSPSRSDHDGTLVRVPTRQRSLESAVDLSDVKVFRRTRSVGLLSTASSASHEQVRRIGLAKTMTTVTFKEEDHKQLRTAVSLGTGMDTGEGGSLAETETPGDNDVYGSPVRPLHAFALQWRPSSSTIPRREEACFLRGSVINPMAFWYRVWHNFVALLVLTNLFLTPLRFGFDASWDFYIVVRIWDVLFGIDIFLMFNVGIMTKKGLKSDRWIIFKNRVSQKGFWLDFLALVPWDAIYASASDAQDPMSYKVKRALGMVRMLRANRLLQVFREAQKNTHFNLLSVVMVKFVVFILICTHTSGCVFYALSNYANYSEETWVHNVNPGLAKETLATRYIHVLFWAVSTFKAGPMSGVLGPYSNSEMILACFTMMVNICLQTYLVSNMAALLTTADTKIYAMRNQLQQLDDFANRHNIPRELRHQLRKSIRFKFTSDQELDQNVLSGMPELYRQRISHVLYEEVLLEVCLFSDCSNLFLRQLHSRLKATMYMPDQQLVNIDEPSGHLQILGEGDAEFRDRGGTIVALVGKCEEISALSFLCKVGQPFAVRTRSTCRLLSMDHANWDAVCQAFPDNLHRVIQNLLHHCESKIQDYIEGSSGFCIYTEMAQIVRETMVQNRETALALFISAAARGDIAEVKRLLTSTNPNISNYDKRTPLHLAASTGQVEVITLLLDTGADVDPVDNFGRTPLLEACRCQHSKVADILFEAGATLGFNEDTVIHVAANELCRAAADFDQLWYLKMLFKYGADPNVGDYDMRTALHVASANGNKSAVEYLLSQNEIDLNLKDNFGRTALMEAVRHGHESVAKTLRKAGAHHGFITDPKDMVPNGIPAGQELCQAAFANQIQYMNNLMSYCDLDVDAADYDLRTALMLACAEGNMRIAVHLVQCGADIKKKDRWGHTAITEARDHGHEKLAIMLEQLAKSANKGQ